MRTGDALALVVLAFGGYLIYRNYKGIAPAVQARVDFMASKIASGHPLNGSQISQLFGGASALSEITTSSVPDVIS